MRKETDLKYWRDFKLKGRYSKIKTYYLDCFTKPVQVTNGRSVYNQKKGLKINLKQSVAEFFSRAFPRPVETKLYHEAWTNEPVREASVHNAITVSTGNQPEMLLSFIRTVRVPEDKNEYCLPPGLGKFPLFDIQAFSSKLPPEVVAQGGIFLPMYRKILLRVFHVYFYIKLITEGTKLRTRSYVDIL
jgi:hypothetical protein